MFSQRWQTEFPDISPKVHFRKSHIIGELLSHLLRKHDVRLNLAFASISAEAERLLGKRLAEEI